MHYPRLHGPWSSLGHLYYTLSYTEGQSTGKDKTGYVCETLSVLGWYWRWLILWKYSYPIVESFWRWWRACVLLSNWLFWFFFFLHYNNYVQYRVWTFWTKPPRHFCRFHCVFKSSVTEGRKMNMGGGGLLLLRQRTEIFNVINRFTRTSARRIAAHRKRWLDY